MEITPPSQRPRAVVLLSGGLDSATALAMAIASGFDCYCLSLEYGQRHRAELDAAARVATKLGAKAHRTVNLSLDQFGGSALTDSSGHASGVAGTIGYMPPEQIRGQQLDEHTDGWAFASLVFEVITNANPFDADTAEGSLFRIDVADRVGHALAVVSGVKSFDDMLAANVREVSAAAAALGIAPGMTGRAAGNVILPP